MIKKVEVNLKEDAIYKVKDGKVQKIEIDKDAVMVIKKKDLKLVTRPDSGFGKHIIAWQDGQIHSEEVRYTMR